MARATSPRTAQPAPRARRTEGPRTTVRLPASLAESADRLADELQISRNDALLRLASRGAQLFERERSVSERRRERWAAVVPGSVDFTEDAVPSPDEARSAVLDARG